MSTLIDLNSIGAALNGLGGVVPQLNQIKLKLVTVGQGLDPNNAAAMSAFSAATVAVNAAIAQTDNMNLTLGSAQGDLATDLAAAAAAALAAAPHGGGGLPNNPVVINNQPPPATPTCPTCATCMSNGEVAGIGIGSFIGGAILGGFFGHQFLKGKH